MPCGLQTIMDFSLTTLPVETALIFWTFWTWAMDCMIIYLCMCVYKVKKERRRAGDFFISLVRVTSNSFFHLALLDLLDARKRKKKNQKKKLSGFALSPKQKIEERDEKRGGGGGGLVGRASAAAAIIVLVFNVIIIIFFFFFFSSTTTSTSSRWWR